MKRHIKYRNNGFTLVEIMTAVVIIAILVGVLIPALSGARRLAMEVRQKAQFTAIGAALELFRNDFGQYPDSYPVDERGDEYTGAQILAEAMAGHDTLGVSKYTRFRMDGFGDVDGNGVVGNNEYLYFAPDDDPNQNEIAERLAERKGPYVEPDKLGVYTVEDLYGTSGTTPEGDETVLITDTFVKKNMHVSEAIEDRTGEYKTAKAGMPVLYFRADTTKILQNQFQRGNLTQRESIYCYEDNESVLIADIPWSISQDKLDAYWSSTDTYDLAGTAAATKFNTFIVNDKMSTSARDVPYNPNSYILMSAGPDGLFGTEDDMFNFDKENN
jgi:prepilin-type N-terminal cleavage/methylation domain-containing protein